MDFKAYTHYLIERHSDLQLPYSFPMKLSFISSPLMYGKAMLVVDEDEYVPVGAAGFVFGTGADGYVNREVIQLEVLYVEKEYRRGRLLLRFLQALVDNMKAEEPNVRHVQFWAAAREPEQIRLFAKILALPGSRSHTAENGLTLYQADYSELEAYFRRFSSANNV
ncbi:hypothetical protein MO973_01250 [Paenibacillus sp. TRM 82003]|nr:hypothetical protein [Paenibacillus sp. TRM 82003]